MSTSPTWTVRGVYHETCASEGHCPYYFGRDKEGGCRYFMVFRVTDGNASGVDLAGVTAIYLGDLPYATYAEVSSKGSEGAIYIDDRVSPEQRTILDTLALEALGGVLMKRVLGVHYVPITVNEGENAIEFTMPTGRMRMELTQAPTAAPCAWRTSPCPSSPTSRRPMRPSGSGPITTGTSNIATMRHLGRLLHGIGLRRFS
jgi:hypothetical protein